MYTRNRLWGLEPLDGYGRAWHPDMMKNKLVNWIRNWFDENGKDCTAVIGISGGKDSSVVAALCVEALGKDRVFGVLMPNGQQPDIDVAYDLVNYLGIQHCEINIFDACSSIRHRVKEAFNDHWSVQSATNLPARVRMTTLYAVSQTIGGRVANTCNLSESLLSWETRWGDAVGDFSPLADLTVKEVKDIGFSLNLPPKFVEKVPSDGLCGSTDEDALGFTYEVVDKYIRTGRIADLDIKKQIDDRVEKYRFKRKPIPYFESGLKRFVD